MINEISKTLSMGWYHKPIVPYIKKTIHMSFHFNFILINIKYIYIFMKLSLLIW